MIDVGCGTGANIASLVEDYDAGKYLGQIESPEICVLVNDVIEHLLGKQFVRFLRFRSLATPLLGERMANIPLFG